VLHALNKRFADYYNTRYRLNGHLYEKRFFIQEIKGDDGILEVTRYLHRNPFKVKMVNTLEEYP
jgi:hypothetical protein